jgi:hypothetical protein
VSKEWLLRVNILLWRLTLAALGCLQASSSLCKLIVPTTCKQKELYEVTFSSCLLLF